MKFIHIFNDQKALVADKQVADDYQPQANESFDLPSLVTYAPGYQPAENDVENPSTDQQISSLQTIVMSQLQTIASINSNLSNQSQSLDQIKQIIMQGQQSQAIDKSKEAK